MLSEIGYPAGTSIHPNLLAKTVETLRETVSGRNLAGGGFTFYVWWMTPGNA